MSKGSQHKNSLVNKDLLVPGTNFPIHYNFCANVSRDKEVCAQMSKKNLHFFLPISENLKSVISYM